MGVDDQANNLRKLMNRAESTRTIAIVSGKGGVGKSNIALNLALLLSAAGNQVAVVDADLALANIDILAGVDVWANMADVLAGSVELEDIIVDLPQGVHLVPGASGLSHLADLTEFDRNRLLEKLTEIETDYDYVIVDCGAGIGNNVLAFAAGADNVMVVTTNEPTSITDAYAVIKVLAGNDYQGHLSVLVNESTSRHQARETTQRIREVARRFLNICVYDAGHVLEDSRVQQAVSRREPLVLTYPRCPASKCLAALATRLCSGKLRTDRKLGFFKRVANWFA